MSAFFKLRVFLHEYLIVIFTLASIVAACAAYFSTGITKRNNIHARSKNINRRKKTLKTGNNVLTFPIIIQKHETDISQINDVNIEKKTSWKIFYFFIIVMAVVLATNYILLDSKFNRVPDIVDLSYDSAIEALKKSQIPYIVPLADHADIASDKVAWQSLEPNIFVSRDRRLVFLLANLRVNSAEFIPKGIKRSCKVYVKTIVMDTEDLDEVYVRFDDFDNTDSNFVDKTFVSSIETKGDAIYLQTNGPFAQCVIDANAVYFAVRKGRKGSNLYGIMAYHKKNLILVGVMLPAITNDYHLYRFDDFDDEILAYVLIPERVRVSSSYSYCFSLIDNTRSDPLHEGIIHIDVLTERENN